MKNKEAEVHIKRYMNIMDTLYPEIKEEFEKIETDKSISKTDVRIIRFSDKIKSIIRILKHIDVNKIAEIIDQKTLETAKHNINFIYEEMLYLQKRLVGDEYIDDLKIPVRKYVEKMGTYSLIGYEKYTKDLDQLTDKFIGMLTHPDNINTYKNQIKRMALGTMSQNEFNKIFDATKHKMKVVPKKIRKFQSFKEYKKDSE
jgi:hypothetical protein